MAAPAVVQELVERFQAQIESYRAGAYNETQLRREFLDPFFEVLGWDVFNRKGYAEAYKEVIHEDAIRIGGRTKAPDYCFRAGSGIRSLFVEAKKPSVDIRDAASPAYQLRRYAWSAKLPVSILTDFEEFAVYDCRIRPEKNDKATTGRIIFLNYTQYLDRWDFLYDLFSPEAIRRGSLEKLVASQKIKKGTAEVDTAFLVEIESWRDVLARNIALRNQGISGRDLNFAVQRTIDRIVFLRICEDRGIETYGSLQGLTNGQSLYARLGEWFRRADQRYNSGLFYFDAEPERGEPPDEMTLGLAIDDKPLRDIIRNLYFPDSPYEFSVLPAEILGQVYEQFLGKVIRLTPGGQAKVEEKPEVRKAGGVYYTPAYIVDYIVANTVGKLLGSPLLPGQGQGEGGLTPKGATKLRILDPACGSGSFLIGAYQFLLDWHRDRYVADDAERNARGRNPTLYRNGRGIWKLTSAERKRILLNNIYGVDIDPQAVEVTKLSLLLKVLEGESDETISNQLRLVHERALPDLAGNIKCGNSLISPDFYNGHQLNLLDEDERYRINVFDWKAEFPAIFQAGGFDVVIGNPPYVRQETLSDFKDYFSRHYEAFDGVADLYTYFMENGLRLLRDRGLFSIIVSSSFLRTTYGKSLRSILKKHAAVLRIVDFGGLPVFANAKDTYVCIPLLEKGPQQTLVEVCKVPSLEVQDVSEYVLGHRFTIPHQRLSEEAWSLKSDEEAEVFAKVVKAGKPLGEYVEGRFFRGVTSGLNEAFIIDAETRKSLITQDRRSSELIQPLLGGEDVRRYISRERGQWLIFTRRGVDIDQYKAIRKHLERWKEDLTPKRNKKAKRGRKPGSYKWYEIQDDVAYYEIFDRPKLIFPDICKGPRFCLDSKGHYLANTAYCLGTDDLYLLGILNSRLFWFAISNISIPFGIRAGKYRYRLIYQYMEKVPIRPIDLSNRTDRSRHDRMMKLVETIQSLHQQLSKARTAGDKTLIQRQIDATDRQIDGLVYELYGLSEAEIAIVEGAT